MLLISGLGYDSAMTPGASTVTPGLDPVVPPAYAPIAPRSTFDALTQFLAQQAAQASDGQPVYEQPAEPVMTYPIAETFPGETFPVATFPTEAYPSGGPVAEIPTDGVWPGADQPPVFTPPVMPPPRKIPWLWIGAGVLGLGLLVVLSRRQ